MMLRLLAVGLSLTVILSACTGGGDATLPSHGPSDVSTGTEEHQVVQRDFSFAYTYQGTLAQSRGVGFTRPRSTSFEPLVESGTEVTVGETVAKMGDERPKAAEDASPAERELGETGFVAAIDGTFEMVDDEPIIVAQGLDAVVEVSAIQALRLTAMPLTGTASVPTTTGTSAASCAATWVVPATADTSAEVRCRIPDDLDTVSGVPATVTVTSAVLDSVTVVPNIYIGTDPEDAQPYVMVVGTDGGVERVDVEPGVTDGVVTVIDSAELVSETLAVPTMTP